MSRMGSLPALETTSPTEAARKTNVIASAKSTVRFIGFLSVRDKTTLLPCICVKTVEIYYAASEMTMDTCGRRWGFGRRSRERRRRGAPPLPFRSFRCAERGYRSSTIFRVSSPLLVESL